MSELAAGGQAAGFVLDDDRRHYLPASNRLLCIPEQVAPLCSERLAPGDVFRE